MTYALIDDLAQRLDGLRADGLYKTERIITSPQGGVVRTDTGEMINLCANTTFAPTIIWASPAIPHWPRRAGLRWRNKAMACPRCASSAAPRRSTQNWSTPLVLPRYARHDPLRDLL